VARFTSRSVVQQKMNQMVAALTNDLAANLGIPTDYITKLTLTAQGTTSGSRLRFLSHMGKFEATQSDLGTQVNMEVTGIF